MATAISSVRFRAEFLTIVLLFSNGWSASAAGQVSNAASELNAAQIAAAIDQVLEQRHPTDTPQWWRSLGPEAPQVIEQKLASTTRVYQRLRLVQALGHFTDPAGLAGRINVLKGIASSTSDDVIRHAAIRSVSDASRGGELDWIAGFLSHQDGQTRRTATLVLKQIDSEAARKKLAALGLDGDPAASAQGPARALKKSGSSVDRPSPDWEGQWKGFWIEPGRVSAGRMTIDAQTAPQSWTAQLVLGKKQSSVRLEAQQVQGAVASGGWLERDGASVGFEARLEREGRHRVLRVRVPERSGTLVLFR